MDMTAITEGINIEVLEDIGYFFNKINEKALFQLGLADSYDDDGDPALALSVEYFHPQITLDDRMRYIAENIVTSGMDYQSIICNTIVSHFYGARGIHQILTRDPNPTTALVNFDLLMNDMDYFNHIKKNVEDAVDMGIGLYGTTELRTSLFGAANKYCEPLGLTSRKHGMNILIWIAGFIYRGIIDDMANAQSLEDLYKVITKIEGVGAYYGYHCSTSNSVNPNINANHDERFCVPGPGARLTLDLLFGKENKMKHGDQVIWFRENYKELIGEIFLHPDTHNIEVDGRRILKEEQDDLKVYGCEVGLCQYGVYHRFKNHPHLINRRKVSRINQQTLNNFFEV